MPLTLPLTNAAYTKGEAVGHDLPLDRPPSGARRDWPVLHHVNAPRSGFARIRRAADEQASYAVFKNPRVGEGPQHDPTDLPIETRHLRGVSGGEPHTGRINEQLLDACERPFKTPCLERLSHVGGSSQ